ncbi:hypothetical protein J8655_06325 [Dickeya oryzae]|nr:hypothetical protein [Dickeya oryzae]MBP2845094.1 hypothetical protein [Dickeya oryzae]
MKSFTGTVGDPFADPVVSPGGFSRAFRRISTLNRRAREAGDFLLCSYR